MTDWLRNTDQDRIPTDEEKRKLSGAVRLLVEKPIADAVLGVLWTRKKATLGLWADTLRSIRHGVIPDTDDPEEIVWRCRAGLKRLAADGNRTVFLQTVSAGQPRTFDDQLLRNLRRERGRRIAWAKMKSSIMAWGECSRCHEKVTLEAAMEGNHRCSRWLHELRHELVDERSRIENEIQAEKDQAEISEARRNGKILFAIPTVSELFVGSFVAVTQTAEDVLEQSLAAGERSRRTMERGHDESEVYQVAIGRRSDGAYGVRAIHEPARRSSRMATGRECPRVEQESGIVVPRGRRDRGREGARPSQPNMTADRRAAWERWLEEHGEGAKVGGEEMVVIGANDS